MSVDVTNKGARAGDEVVQLYVRYPESKVPRPQKQLRGFQRVEIASGATRTVTFDLTAEDLAYWTPRGTPGSSSRARSSCWSARPRPTRT